MAQDAPVPTTPTYCTAADVAVLRREKPYSAHEDRNRPTLAQVKALILDAEDVVDRTTRHAWRERKLADHEYHDLLNDPDVYGMIPVNLRHRQIREPLSAGSGDVLEVRAGTTWEDYLTTRTQGIGGDFWVQVDTGVLYIKRRFFRVTRDAVRIRYRYGETVVPPAIKRATALLTAVLLEETSVRPAGDGGDMISVETRARRWQQDADRILANFVELGGVF